MVEMVLPGVAERRSRWLRRHMWDRAQELRRQIATTPEHEAALRELEDQFRALPIERLDQWVGWAEGADLATRPAFLEHREIAGEDFAPSRWAAVVTLWGPRSGTRTEVELSDDQKIAAGLLWRNPNPSPTFGPTAGTLVFGSVRSLKVEGN